MAAQPQQQQQPRWLRLPSIARPTPAPTPAPAPAPAPAPTPTPAPAPRPALPLPTFRQVTQQQAQTQPQGTTNGTAQPPAPSSLPTSPVRTSVPSSPVRPRAPAPTSSVPSSPSARPASPAPKPTTSSLPASPAPVSATTRTVEPAVVQTRTPPDQTKPKPTTPPPSPLTLPPSQLRAGAAEPDQSKIPPEAEQKTVVVQKTIEKGDFTDNLRSSIANLRKQEQSRTLETKEKGHLKKLSSDSDDSGMRVITIAGENKGAFMEVFHSPKKSTSFGGTPHHLHKKGNGRESSSSSSSDEGSSKKGHKFGKATGSSNPMSAFMNSNVQGVNNSIVYNSTCTHHDPGVHMMLAKKPAGGGFQIKEQSNGFQK